MDLLERLRRHDALAAEAAAEIAALRARLAAAEHLAVAAEDLLAAWPGAPEAATALGSALARFRPSTAPAGGWSGANKLAFLKSFTGLAPLTQLHFIEFARRFMADDGPARELAGRVQRGELTRDELLVAIADSSGA
jgi:hypothetical protein